jgi:hypothetical protein
MCISNKTINQILKIQERRRNARIRYYTGTKDGWGKIIDKTEAERITTCRDRYRTKISYEESLSNPLPSKARNIKPETYDIITTKCPIPYMPAMPITKCLNCNHPLRIIK